MPHAGFGREVNNVDLYRREMNVLKIEVIIKNTQKAVFLHLLTVTVIKHLLDMKLSVLMSHEVSQCCQEKIALSVINTATNPEDISLVSLLYILFQYF